MDRETIYRVPATSKEPRNWSMLVAANGKQSGFEGIDA